MLFVCKYNYAFCAFELCCDILCGGFSSQQSRRQRATWKPVQLSRSPVICGSSLIFYIFIQLPPIFKAWKCSADRFLARVTAYEGTSARLAPGLPPLLINTLIVIGYAVIVVFVLKRRRSSRARSFHLEPSIPFSVPIRLADSPVGGSIIVSEMPKHLLSAFLLAAIVGGRSSAIRWHLTTAAALDQ